MLRRINVSFAAVLHLLHLLHIRPPLVLSSVVRATHTQHPHPAPTHSTHTQHPHTAPTPSTHTQHPHTHIYNNTHLLLYTCFAEFFILFCAD